MPLLGASAASIEIDLAGSCAIAGTPFSVRGTLTGLTDQTKGQAVSQLIGFSAANQTTGRGALILGKEEAAFTGTVSRVIAGSNEGKEWGGS
jgi:hypothetical protein